MVHAPQCLNPHPNPSFNPNKCKIMKKWVDANYSRSKVVRIIFLKVHINGKNNTKMEKMLKINV